MNHNRVAAHLPVALLSLAAMGGLAMTTVSTAAPLKALAANPRYFTSGDGKAVYLTGSHTWNNLQHNGVYPAVDFDDYLDFLQRYHHNLIRLWAWEQAAWDPWAKGFVEVGPLPFARTGPGEALDGKPRFDVLQLDENYFRRLRRRVEAAANRGIYVSIMLFQGWSVERKGQAGNPWRGHPFHPANNINGIDGDLNGDGQGPEIHTLAAPPAIREAQRAYIRRVIDTVNDLDNVLYEIGNEMHKSSVQWQYEMIDYIHQCERARPKQHPVGMTGAPINNAALFASPADWIAPTGADGYKTDPPPADGRKVIISDVDHVWPRNFRQWPWKSFIRGLNTAFMDLYGAAKIGDKEIKDLRFVGDWLASHETARRRMGATRMLAERIDLAAMTPHPKLSSTGYCLAAPGREYVVYQPEHGPFHVALPESAVFAVEWIDPETGQAKPDEPVNGAATTSFTPPSQSDAVLHLLLR